MGLGGRERSDNRIKKMVGVGRKEWKNRERGGVDNRESVARWGCSTRQTLADSGLVLIG